MSGYEARCQKRRRELEEKRDVLVPQVNEAKRKLDTLSEQLNSVCSELEEAKKALQPDELLQNIVLEEVSFHVPILPLRKVICTYLEKVAQFWEFGDDPELKTYLFGGDWLWNERLSVSKLPLRNLPLEWTMFFIPTMNVNCVHKLAFYLAEAQVNGPQDIVHLYEDHKTSFSQRAFRGRVRANWIEICEMHPGYHSSYNSFTTLCKLGFNRCILDFRFAITHGFGYQIETQTRTIRLNQDH